MKGRVPQSVLEYAEFSVDLEHQQVTLEPLHIKGADYYLKVVQYHADLRSALRIKFQVIEEVQGDGEQLSVIRTDYLHDRERSVPADSSIRRTIYPVIEDTAWVRQIARDIKRFRDARDMLTLHMCYIEVKEFQSRDL